MVKLNYKIDERRLDGLFLGKKELSEAAARGIQQAIVKHLKAKPANRRGFPTSNYYADVADSVSVIAAGDHAAVEISKEGAALHYEGGTVRPKDGRGALAIPLAAQVYGKMPSEWSGFRRGDEPDEDDVLQMIWPRNSNHGFLKDRDTGELLYLLVHEARIPRDPDFLPNDEALHAAGGEAIEEALW